MAVDHRCWQFDIQTASKAFDGLADLDDVLAPEISDRAARIRSDRSREDQLVILRLDPADEEIWSLLLRPEPVDFGYERAGAARLQLLLADVCEEAVGIRVGPANFEQFLVAIGRPRERIGLTLRGRASRPSSRVTFRRSRRRPGNAETGWRAAGSTRRPQPRSRLT